MAGEKTKRNIDMTGCELIYCDKVVGVGMGAGVSKIILGLEGVDGEVGHHKTLVIPTQALVDLVELVGKSLKTNYALKTQLLEQWKTLGEKFEAVDLAEKSQPTRKPTKKKASN